MNCAIFISDVGFGHMVRQRQIIFNLKKEFKNLKITIFHHKNLHILKKNFGKSLNYVDNFNNIKLHTTKNGFDKKKALITLNSWEKKKDIFLKKKNKSLKKFDFFISDLVPEISYYAKKNNKPCFSICHFTWDWFFKKLYKRNLRTISLMKRYIKMSTKIYFPPFTFKEINNSYKKKKKVNFITNKLNMKTRNLFKKPKKILIMNNGTGALTHSINKIILNLSSLKKYKFYISSSNISKKKEGKIKKIKNVFLINNSLKKMYSYISKVDVVVARGGYNTISECLVLRKPSILSYENLNPEVNENIKIMKKNILSSSMNFKDWEKVKFKKKIENFLKKDYYTILSNIIKKKFKNNGANQIVKDIKKELKLYDKNNC